MRRNRREFEGLIHRYFAGVGDRIIIIILSKLYIIMLLIFLGLAV